MCPDRPDLSSLVDQVLQVVIDEHDGQSPGEMLGAWSDARLSQNPNDHKNYTEQEREKLMKAFERWSNWGTVDREFGEVLSELYGRDIVDITELQARRMIHVLRKWLSHKGYRDVLKQD